MTLKEPTQNWSQNKPLYKPVKSSNPKKKGMVYVMKEGKKRLIHFGLVGMGDYTTHKDPVRRANYLKRSAGIKDKNGQLTKDNKNSSNYWARKVLW